MSHTDRLARMLAVQEDLLRLARDIRNPYRSEAVELLREVDAMIRDERRIVVEWERRVEQERPEETEQPVPVERIPFGAYSRGQTAY